MSRTWVFRIARGFYTVAREPGEKSESSTVDRGASDPLDDSDEAGSLNVLPELMRRFFSAGLSSFFFTEEALRKALGDTLPQDWSDFAVEQSERTRAEFLDRLSAEIGRTLENTDLAEMLSKLLDGNSLEINASVRLRRESSPGDSKVKIRMKRA